MIYFVHQFRNIYKLKRKLEDENKKITTSKRFSRAIFIIRAPKNVLQQPPFFAPVRIVKRREGCKCLKCLDPPLQRTVHTAQLDSTAQCTQHTARLDSSAQCTAGQAAASLCIWKASPLGKLHNLSGISCKIAMGDSRNTVYLPDPSSSLLDVLLGSYICSVFCVICVMCVFCCANVASVQMLQLFRGEWQWLPLLYKVSSNQMRIKWES